MSMLACEIFDEPSVIGILTHTGPTILSPNHSGPTFIFYFIIIIFLNFGLFCYNVTLIKTTH